MAQALFQYIINNLDEDGCFTPATLPDHPHDSILHILGSGDATIYTMNIPSNMEDASKLVKLLRAYQEEPVQPRRQDIYRFLNNTCLAACLDPFIAAFDNSDMTYAAYDLARRFFYNARDREPVKFALLLFGLHGMERIRKEDPILWRDIVSLAHCEEFTFSFLFSCRMAGFSPQKEIWELLGCTKGWGRVFATIDCQCKDEAQRRWLLVHGTDLEVEYPPLAIKLLQETHLMDALQDKMDLDAFESACVMVNNYLSVLTNFSQETIEELFNIASIDTYALLTGMLQQIEHYFKTTGFVEHVLNALTIGISLRQLIDEQNYNQLTPNQCQLLLGTCDKIIYSRDWSTKIEADLIHDDEINYELCDLAYELDYDIWQTLYEFWLEHPQEYALFPYLLSYEGGDRSERVLRNICANMPIFLEDESALLTPLRYLFGHPHEHEELVCTALTGIYDLPRGVACNVLDAWEVRGNELPATIRAALRKGEGMSQNQLVKGHIRYLLEGEEFSLEKFLEE